MTYVSPIFFFGGLGFVAGLSLHESINIIHSKKDKILQNNYYITAIDSSTALGDELQLQPNCA